MAKNGDEAVDPAKGKSKLKLIVIIVVAVLLAAALAVGGTLWLLPSDQDGADDKAEAQEQFEPSHYYAMSGPFIVTVSDKPADGESSNGRSNRSHHLQIYLALQSRDEAALAAAETNAPLLKDRLRTLFSSQDFSEMLTLAGKKRLAKDTATLVNKVLSDEGAPPIDGVLFTNFVLQ